MSEKLFDLEVVESSVHAFVEIGFYRFEEKVFCPLLDAGEVDSEGLDAFAEKAACFVLRCKIACVEILKLSQVEGL